MWTLQHRRLFQGLRVSCWRRGRVAGFSLAEVIIVSVVMTVLLATVWSLFVMQQRTLERGQRLSRNTRVVLALQRQMQDDFSRLVLRRWDASESQVGGGAAAASATSDDTAPSQRFDRFAGSDLASAEAVPSEFRFAGGSDWLIIDVRRPAYQWGAFDQVGVDPLVDSLASSVGLGAASGVGVDMGGAFGEDDPDQLPQRSPTAFQRIVYLWLTDEEIEEVTGLRFGRDAEATGNPVVSESTLGPISPTSGEGGPSESPSESGGSRRTLVRLVSDWSWPREGELGGETWDAALGGAEASDRMGMDFGAGLPGSLGSTTPERRQWLRRMLLPVSDAYRDFHLQAGSAISVGTAPGGESAFAPRTGLENVDGSVALNAGSSNTTSFAAEEYLLPDRWQPQVDWFPEVVAGKFLYHDGTRWQSSFTEREDRKLPQAVRFEYTVDARWFPVIVNEATESDVQGAVGQMGPASLPSEPLGNAADALAFSGSELAIDLNARPEFPHVVGYTFLSQASRSGASLRGGTGEEVDEGEGESADPFARLGGGVGADRPGNASEFGSRPGARSRGF